MSPSTTRRRRALRRRLGEHMAFILGTGQTVEGWLEEVVEGGFLLRACRLTAEGLPAATPLDGEVFLPAENVSFVQIGVPR